MSVRKKMSLLRNAAIFTAIAWFLLTFMVAPVVGVLRETFFTEGAFSLAAIEKLVASARVQNALKNTYTMTFWTVITVTVVGLFQILVTEYFSVWGAKFMAAVFMTPLIYGGISLVTGYNYIYSQNGFVTRLLTQWFPGMNQNWFTGFTGVLFVHTFAMTTYHILFVKTAFKSIDYSTIEAAKSLGANSLQTFFRVALPVVKPALLGGKNFYMINGMILNLNNLRSYDLSALLSLVLAATCIALFISVASSLAIHKKPGKATTLLEMTLLIPWILPATMLVVDMITIYSGPSALTFGQTLQGGLWLLPVDYEVCNISSAMRLVRALLHNINNAHEEAVHALDGGAFYTFRRVVLPAMLPTAVSVGAITFNGLLAEYTVSALLYNVNNVPLGSQSRFSRQSL